MTYRASGSITLYFDDIEFDDDGVLCLRDQAIEALRNANLSEGDVVEHMLDVVRDESGTIVPAAKLT